MNLKRWPTGEYLARSILVVGGFGKYSTSTVDRKEERDDYSQAMVSVQWHSKGCERTSMCLGNTFFLGGGTKNKGFYEVFCIKS